MQNVRGRKVAKNRQKQELKDLNKWTRKRDNNYNETHERMLKASLAGVPKW